MRRLICLAAVLAVLAAPALAGSFEVSVSQIGDVFAGDPVSFDISIKNTGSVSDSYSVSLFSEGEMARWVTQESASMGVNPSATGKMTITITPNADARADTYIYKLNVMSSDGTTYSKNIMLTVRQKTTAGAVKNLNLTCLSCYEEAGVTMEAENIGTAVLNDVKIVVTAGPLGKEVTIGSLKLREAKKAEASFSLKGLEPGDYLVTAEMFASGKSLNKKTQAFTIPVKEDVEYGSSVSMTPFGRFTTLTASNQGNDRDDAELKAAVLEEWWVGYSGPAPTAKGAEWSWTRALEPGESIEIKYAEFYWPIMILIIIIVSAAGFFYMRSTALVISKSVYASDGLFGVSVVVKNKGKPIESAIVKDVVPDGYEVSEHFETVKPITRKVAEGTELLWKVDVLPTGEERVLHYKMRPLPYAKPNLPKATARGRRGRAMVAVTSAATTAPLKTEPKLKVEFE